MNIMPDSPNDLPLWGMAGQYKRYMQLRPYDLPLWGLIEYYERFIKLKPEEQHDWKNTMLHNMPNTPETLGASRCSSFGSTGMVKEYLWGPNFLAILKLWDYIATTGARLKHGKSMKVMDLYACTASHQESTMCSNEKTIMVISGKTPLVVRPKLEGLHVVFDPDQVEIACGLNPNFMADIFDLEKCSFHSTGSKLTNSAKIALANQDIQPYDQMRCWDGGSSFYTCQYMNQHFCHFMSEIHIEDRKLISTDFWNRGQLFVDYWNGDIVDWSTGDMCECGQVIDNIEFEHRKRTFAIKGVSYDASTWRRIVIQATKVPHCYFYPNDNKLTIYLVCDKVTDAMRQAMYGKFGGLQVILEPCEFITARKTAIVLDAPWLQSKEGTIMAPSKKPTSTSS